MRRRVYQMIGERSRKFGEELSRRLCEVFALRARDRLLTYATPKDNESYSQLVDLASTIVAKESSTGLGYEVSIPVDNEGLLLFLEYGTGTMGALDEHPEAGKVGWKYALNRESYINEGWFFNRYPTRRNSSIGEFETAVAYLDANDINPVKNRVRYVSERVRVKGYPRDGKKVKSYTRKRPVAKTKVYEYDDSGTAFSRGLLPVRFIYDTKQELREILDLFRSYKGGKLTFKDVFDKIDELERRAV